MSSLKEKLDSKKNERERAELREIFTIIMQAEKKDLDRYTEVLKRVTKSTFFLA